MASIAELLDTRRWVYWLDETQPEPGRTDRFRVSIVFENEQGHYPTGGGQDRAPWYWDRETCRTKNELRGLTEEDEFKIVASSMGKRRQ